MTDDPRDGSDKDRDAPTVRDLKGPGVPTDTVPDVVGLYVPPRPPPEVSRHRTLDLMPVRIAAAADPRRAPTERRLVAPDRPQRGSIPAWLVGGVLIVFGFGVWALARTSSPPRESVPAISVAPPIPPIASAVAPPTEPTAAPLPSSVSVATAPDPSPAHAPSPAPVAPKTARPPEPAKKRNQPWLE